MSDPHHPPKKGQAPARSPGYETRDADPGLVFKWAVGLTLMVVFSFLFMGWLFVSDLRKVKRDNPPLSPLLEPAPLPPNPMLRADPVKDLEALRAYEAELLEHYAWRAQDRGLAQIPLAHAMELAATLGLPDWSETVSETTAPAPEAAPPAESAEAAEPVEAAAPADAAPTSGEATP